MKIAQSNVVMASNRQYMERGAKGTAAYTAGKSFVSVARDRYEAGCRSSERDSKEWMNYSKNGTLDVSSVSGESVQLPRPTQIQKDLVSRLLERMKTYGLITADDARWDGQQISETVSIGRNVKYEERESTFFQAQGVAVTEDGRTIDFNISLMMSRSYMEYTNSKSVKVESALVDPLVINVGAETASVRDQTFIFDLDGDGTQEEIPMPADGSGFLALDINGDGVINDGGELFGTASGDGFADLQKYDSDGNGWIDENDEIFSKLRVWCKGEHGEDILMNLKEADVGAIYLGSMETEFTLYGEMGTGGVIRSSGFFLKESGEVSTVQHVDLAVGNASEIRDVTRSAGDPQEESQEQEEQTTSYVSADEHRTSNSQDSRSAAENRRREKEERQRAEEARRMKKREQREILEERFAKRRAEHKRLMEQVAERQQEHKEELRESYEWLRMRRSYNLA